MNANMKKFYEIELADYEEYKENLKDIYGLTDEGVEIARNIYRARYNLITTPPYHERMETEPILWQSDHTSDMCLRAFLGDKYDDDFSGRIRRYDSRQSHLLWIKRYIDDDSAILIRDEDVGSIGIGIVVNKEIEYFELSRHYCGPLGYIDVDWEPNEEKKQKCIEIWKEKGIM